MIAPVPLADGTDVDLAVGDHVTVAGERIPEVVQRVTRYGVAPLADGSNVVVVPHALTGSSRCVEWWPGIVGPGALFDTARYHVVGVAALGGCYGTTGPRDRAPDGRPWGARFPRVDVADMVDVQRRALAALGITRVGTVIGGSLGGMQALRWAIDAGDDVGRAIVVGADDHTRALIVGLDAIGRRAIAAHPEDGMRIARMIATLTYKSDALLEGRHGNRADRSGAAGRFDIEGYLDRQADALAERFDPHAYATLTDAMDACDLRAYAGRPGPARLVFAGLGGDWLFPPDLIEATARRYRDGGWSSSYVFVPSDHGHDAFLAEDASLAHALRPALV